MLELIAGARGGVMDRDQFIKVLEGCIESATGRNYPDIDWERLSDRGLINCAELVRDLLERRVLRQFARDEAEARGERLH